MTRRTQSPNPLRGRAGMSHMFSFNLSHIKGLPVLSHGYLSDAHFEFLCPHSKFQLSAEHALRGIARGVSFLTKFGSQ